MQTGNIPSPFRMLEIASLAGVSLKEWRANILTDLGFLPDKFTILFILIRSPICHDQIKQ
jgi:hypothetical protein